MKIHDPICCPFSRWNPFLRTNSTSRFNASWICFLLEWLLDRSVLVLPLLLRFVLPLFVRDVLPLFTRLVLLALLLLRVLPFAFIESVPSLTSWVTWVRPMVAQHRRLYSRSTALAIFRNPVIVVAVYLQLFYGYGTPMFGKDTVLVYGGVLWSPIFLFRINDSPSMYEVWLLSPLYHIRVCRHRMPWFLGSSCISNRRVHCRSQKYRLSLDINIRLCEPQKERFFISSTLR